MSPQTVCSGGTGGCEGLSERGGRPDRCKDTVQLHILVMILIVTGFGLNVFCYLSGF